MSIGDFVMPVGKYKGYSLDDINQEEPSYLEWVYNNFKEGEVKDAVESYLEVY